jgi:hypothetical protein
MAERPVPLPEALKDLGEQFSDPAKSSARILILISLALNRKMSVIRLLSLTGTRKGKPLEPPGEAGGFRLHNEQDIEDVRQLPDRRRDNGQGARNV